MSNHSGYKDIFSSVFDGVQFAVEFQQGKAQLSCGFNSFGLCLKAQAWAMEAFLDFLVM